MNLIFSNKDIDKIPAELVVLMHYQGDVPFKDLLGVLDWRINGRLSAFVQEQHYSGKARELLLMPSELRFMAQEILVLGLGKRDYFDETHVSQVLDYLIETLVRKKASQVCFSLSQILKNEFDWRNAIHLLLSKLADYDCPKEIILREPPTFIKDAKKRQWDLGAHVHVVFEN